MTEDPSNCYEVNFPDCRHTTMCNDAKHILVVFPVTKDGVRVEARVNVLVEFNGASTEGTYDCTTSFQPITDFFPLYC